MITGYLWLQDAKDCTYKKIFYNIRRFIYVLATIGFAYAIMERFFETRSLSIALFLNSMADVLSGNLWDHMWYMYAIIGIYFILPVLKKIFTNSTRKDLLYFTALLFIFSILSPLIHQFTGYRIPVNFPVSTQVLYVCIGGLLAKTSPVKKASVPLLGFCLSSVATFLTMIYTETPNALLVLLECTSSFSLFLAVQAMPLKDTKGRIRTFSECTFGIYLFHPLFTNVMIKLLHIYPLRYPLLISLPLTCVLILVFTFAITYTLRRIPFVKKYIL